jgi:hypothetical protein
MTGEERQLREAIIAAPNAWMSAVQRVTEKRLGRTR